MTDGLVLPVAMAEALLEHATAELPMEACGLLAGYASSGTAVRFCPARNLEASAHGFEIAPEDLVRIMLGIEEAGEELVATFHSHPRGPAVPSRRDIASARYPVVHLIAGLGVAPGSGERNLRAWRIEGGAAREVELELA